MNASKLHCALDCVGYTGCTLSTEQWIYLSNSLTILQAENHFKNVYLWGLILGQEADYYIAYGYEKDALFGRKFYYRPTKSSEINLDSSNSPSSVTDIKEEDLSSDAESLSLDFEKSDIDYSKQKNNKRKREISDDIETVFMSYLEMKRKKFASEQDNADMLFFKSILPEMARLTPSQKINFKICILKTLKNIMVNGSSTWHEPT